MIRVFKCINKFHKDSIMIDPSYPDHEEFNVKEYEQWKEFYPETRNDSRQKKSPTPIGPMMQISV